MQTASFTISSDPGYLDVSAGDTGGDWSDITVTPIGSFTGPVTLSVTSITDANGAAASGVSAAFESSNGPASSGVSVPGNASDTLWVTASSSAPQGSYTITLTGTDSGGNTTTTQLTVQVDAGFNLFATPQNVTLAPGSSTVAGGSGLNASPVITATSAGDATGATITILQANIYDENGDEVTDGSVSISAPGSVTVGGAGSPATITVGSGAANGSTYTVAITGQDAAGNTSYAWISVTVGAPGLSLQANPSTVSVNAGDTTGALSVVTVTPTGGFAGSVGLSYTTTRPSGYAGTLPVVIFSPTSVSITDTNSQTSNATITADATVVPGQYAITLTGASGAVTASKQITVVVNSAGSQTLSITTGSNSGNVDLPIDLTATGSLASTTGYRWSTGTVWRSDTASGTYSVYTGNDITYNLIDQNDPSNTATNAANPLSGATLNNASNALEVQATFGTPGYYIIQVNATAAVSGKTYTATGYIGGNPPSGSSSSSSQNANAKTANAATANDSTPTPNTPVTVSGWAFGYSFSDAWGQFIANQWFYGGGRMVNLYQGDTYNSSKYGKSQPIEVYMMANDDFTSLAHNAILPFIQNFSHTALKGTTSIRFHGEVQNDTMGPAQLRGKIPYDLTGYNLMHGSKASVGDVQASVSFSRSSPLSPKVNYQINWSWNDIIDVNSSYSVDIVVAAVSKIFGWIISGNPTDFQYRIRWSTNGYFVQGSGRSLGNVTGWPLTSP
ncbi:MAG: hypothetical protein P4L33_00680 [Capsulimonadaceae bacterium]|nr:hypothetical protein [Capsulimonadaceae bacterium]